MDESFLQTEFSWEEQKNGEKTWKNDGEEVVLGAAGDPSENGKEEKGFSFRCFEKLQEIECGEKRVAPKSEVDLVIDCDHEVRNCGERIQEDNNGRTCFRENKPFDKDEYPGEKKVEYSIESCRDGESL